MAITERCSPAAVLLLALTLLSPAARAQTADYQASWAAYQAMKQRAGGGKPPAKLPDWSGVWTGGGSDLPFYSLDANGTLRGRNGSGGPRRAPPAAELPALTPAYEARLRKLLQDRARGIEWDYISNCIPSGFPRWAASHFLKEFVITPTTVYLINEEGSEVRRVYTDGRGHIARDEAYPLYEGDSVGFWDGDTLVVHTIDLKDGTWDRSGVAYSEQINTVERIRKLGDNLIEDRMIAYDRESLRQPWNLRFEFQRVVQPADLRIRHWSCNENNNVVQDAQGGSTHRLPGETGYRDADQPLEPPPAR